MQPEARPKKRETRAKIARDLEISDLRWVLSAPQGRRFYWRVMGMAGVYSDTLQTEPVMLGRFLGRRSLGQELLGEVLEECPDAYLQMQREAMTAEKNEKTEQASIDKEDTDNA